MAIVAQISFENDDDAIEFFREYQKAEHQKLTGYGRLVAFYKVPTLFCNQIDPFPHKQEGWTFRESRGWWVCPICLRPSKPNSEVATFKLHGSYGFNIIEKIQSAEKGSKL